ncbi:hypothetical protein [Acinetobacter haemolyticus]|uniref:hypothetical protein n=1 Tax=Acinetobacter haemolyticus TaxID=29430 RepID=UPI002DB5828F|nr:hypothetical protein [Acinetobacter haemolyticus]MEB6676377.1 hypothetical protein [Acinetobacter haemolyticus]
MVTQEQIKESYTKIQDNYTIIANYFVSNTGEKIYLGQNNGICHFCDGKDATFDKEAHAISRFFGNDQLILLNECDGCNKKFGSSLEPHIDNFTKPFRTVAQIDGRKGIPKTVAPNQKSYYKIQDGIQQILDPKDSDFSKIDFEKQEITQTFTLGSYIPSAVYKSFIKYALSCLPSESLKAHKRLLAWLIEKENYTPLFKPLLAMKTFIPGVMPLKHQVVATIFEKKDKNDEALISKYFMFGYGNFIYQIPIFTDHEINLMFKSTVNFKFTRIFTPHSLLEYYPLAEQVQYDAEDFSSHEVCKKETRKMIQGFDKIVEIPIDELEVIKNQAGHIVDVKLKKDKTEKE